MRDQNEIKEDLSKRREMLYEIKNRWYRYQDLQKMTSQARQEFIDVIMKASRMGITQSKISESCIKGNSHLSRGRISQFVMEAKKHDAS